MAGQRGGLPLLLLSLAVLDLTLATTVTDVTATMSTSVPTSLTPMETSALLPTTDPTTAATLPPSSSESSTLERSSTSLETSSFSPSTTPTVTAATLPPSSPDTSTMGAFTASIVPLRSSPAASSMTTPQVTGSTALSTPDGTSVPPEPTQTRLGLTTSTPTPAPAATTSNGTDSTTVTSVGTGTASAVISFGVEKNTLPPSDSAPLSSTGAGTTFGITTRQEPAVATLLGSTSLGTGSTSFHTAAAPTVTSDEPHWTASDTTATAVTSTGGPGSTPTQLAETTAGTTAGAASETPSSAAGECSSHPTPTAGRGGKSGEGRGLWEDRAWRKYGEGAWPRKRAELRGRGVPCPALARQLRGGGAVSRLYPRNAAVHQLFPLNSCTLAVPHRKHLCPSSVIVPRWLSQGIIFTPGLQLYPGDTPLHAPLPGREAGPYALVPLAVHVPPESLYQGGKDGTVPGCSGGPAGLPCLLFRAPLGPAVQLMSAWHRAAPWEYLCRVETPPLLPTPRE
ncbi:mucin-5AC-like [Pezoporus wallicus]|uniref:mucin-5AC-like n=1 Tax=Pezoporus wallicus TaxID=35540 RepID=UPI002550FC8A|nr:mucin-5AC-like [Pezoporus wallicus]